MSLKAAELRPCSLTLCPCKATRPPRYHATPSKLKLPPLHGNALVVYRAKASEEVGSASQDIQASFGGRDATQSLTPCVSARGGKAVSVEWKCASGVRSNGSLIVTLVLIDGSRKGRIVHARAVD